MKPPRFLFTTGLLFMVAFSTGFSQAPATDELTKLRQENQQLREENQRLRQLVIQGKASTPLPYAPPSRSPATALAAAPAAPASAQGAPLDHWLTLSSNKRHNSS